MFKTSEFVSIGHPDKIADYISSYLLDRYIEKDPTTRYAVEVQIKDYYVTLGGEVSSNVSFTDEQITNFVREAVTGIGYTKSYQKLWGEENTICGGDLSVTVNISQQSPDIAQGLNGWGDQGIFFGMATNDYKTFEMPYDHTIAKRLCKTLFDSGVGGLDIKTQVVTEDNCIRKVIVAVPLLKKEYADTVRGVVKASIDGDYELIINGTGRYIKHASIADCGTTGRKLAVDFYGGNCMIGGGSPWTKDASKADLTLNLLARRIAKKYTAKYGCDTFVKLACCIGRKEVEMCVQDAGGNVLEEYILFTNPAELRRKFKLDTPIYSSMCRWGLFGEYQQDKAWENNILIKD